MHQHISQQDDQHRLTTLNSESSTIPDAQPAMQGNAAQRRAAVLQLQRRHGNAFVQRQMASIQRSSPLVPLDDKTSSDDAASTSIGDGSASIKAENGVVTIDATMVNVKSAMTDHSGVVKASAVIADHVSGSTYTPGAGNLW